MLLRCLEIESSVTLIVLQLPEGKDWDCLEVAEFVFQRKAGNKTRNPLTY